MDKIKIGVVFGGRSGEHEISIRSATTVINQINKDKYTVIPIAITKEGKWLNPFESVGILPAETQELVRENSRQFSGASIAVLGDTKFPGITKLAAKEIDEVLYSLDVIFPVLHGTFGEDGTIQGLFEMSGIPYIGCGVLASSCGMDKVIMKTLFRDAGLPQCEYVWFLRSEWEQNNNLVFSQIENKLGYPCFVKPANSGSSVGVTKVDNLEQLREGIEIAAKYDRKIIVEENLNMRELECAVIGNDEPIVSLPGEYVIHNEDKSFLDYTEKYAGTGNNEFVVPALLSQELTEKIQKMSIDAFKSVDGSGFARVDFFVRNDSGALLINEINTIPGLTDASGFPKMWKESGMEFSDMLDSLVEYAIQRHKDKSRNKTNL